MRRPKPPVAILFLLLLGTGCASAPLLSNAPPPIPEDNEGLAQQYMLEEMSRHFPPGNKVIVHAVGPELRTQASGTVVEWNAADRTLVLEDCRVREKPSTWISRSPYLEWAERDVASPQVPIAHLAIPLAEIKSLGPVAGASLQRGSPGTLDRPAAAKAPALTTEQEQQLHDRERRIRASAGPPF